MHLPIYLKPPQYLMFINKMINHKSTATAAIESIAGYVISELATFMMTGNSFLNFDNVKLPKCISCTSLLYTPVSTSALISSCVFPFTLALSMPSLTLTSAQLSPSRLITSSTFMLPSPVPYIKSDIYPFNLSVTKFLTKALSRNFFTSFCCTLTTPEELNTSVIYSSSVTSCPCCPNQNPMPVSPNVIFFTD